MVISRYPVALAFCFSCSASTKVSGKEGQTTFTDIRLKKVAERLFLRWIIFQEVLGIEIRALRGTDFLPPTYAGLAQQTILIVACPLRR